MTPEAKVKKKVVAILKQHDAYFFYPVTGGYGRSGVLAITDVSSASNVNQGRINLHLCNKPILTKSQRQVASP